MFKIELKYAYVKVDQIKNFFLSGVAWFSKYDLGGNKWLRTMFDLREKWALVYHRSSFCETIITQRSEIKNKYFKMFFKRKFPLGKLIKQYKDSTLISRENCIKISCQQTKPILFVELPMLQQVSESIQETCTSTLKMSSSSPSCLFECNGLNVAIYTYIV